MKNIKQRILAMHLMMALIVVVGLNAMFHRMAQGIRFARIMRAHLERSYLRKRSQQRMISMARGDRALAKSLALRCGRPTRKSGRLCSMLAGWDTSHPGYGPCRIHGRKKHHDAWRLAVDIAKELNVTPWDALLMSVRSAAGRVAWVDNELTQAVRRNDGDMNVAEVKGWLKESREERVLMARMAKAAIDAGVAERLVRNVEMEGKIVAEVIGRVIDTLDLSAEKRMLAFDEAHRQLLALESPSGTPAEVQGTWTAPGVVDPGVAGGDGQGETEEESGKDGS